MIVPGFIGASYVAQGLTADAEDLYNMYTERSESQGATTDMSLYPTPGVSLLSTAAAGAGRAHFAINGREFAVIGDAFIEIDSAGVQTNRGTVAVDGKQATISSNGDGGAQIFVTSGTNGYILDLLTNVFSQIAFLNGKAYFGDYLGGYFIALNVANDTFYLSNLLDGTTWDPTDFAQRSIQGDTWVAMKVSGQYVWLMGSKTSEAWYNSGASPFPFVPYQSGVIKYGIAAPYSLCTLGDELFWVGASNEGQANVLRMGGFKPEVISTFPLQYAISNYSTYSDAQGDSYSDLGHNFYVLTFPTAGITWAYDTTTVSWAKRATWIEENAEWTVWRPRWHASAFGQHRFLDAQTGALYNVSSNFQLDVEERPIRRLRRAPALMDDLERVFYAWFAVDLQPATATTHTGQGSDPQVMMRFSDNGGQTWSSEQWRTAGKVGKFDTRVEWFRLGCGRRRVFEIVMTDPVPWRITNAYMVLGQQPQSMKGAG